MFTNIMLFYTYISWNGENGNFRSWEWSWTPFRRPITVHENCKAFFITRHTQGGSNLTPMWSDIMKNWTNCSWSFWFKQVFNKILVFRFKNWLFAQFRSAFCSLCAEHCFYWKIPNFIINSRINCNIFCGSLRGGHGWHSYYSILSSLHVVKLHSRICKFWIVLFFFSNTCSVNMSDQMWTN